jgi:hypothetical protein
MRCVINQYVKLTSIFYIVSVAYGRTLQNHDGHYRSGLGRFRYNIGNADYFREISYAASRAIRIQRVMAPKISGW